MTHGKNDDRLDGPEAAPTAPAPWTPPTEQKDEFDGVFVGVDIVGGDVDKTGGGDLIFTSGIIEETVANPVIAGWQK